MDGPADPLDRPGGGRLQPACQSADAHPHNPDGQTQLQLRGAGARGTGKSFVYREVSPYSILISGGKTTVANLFYHMGTGKVGLVGLWDVVAFDEVAGIQFDDKTAVQIMKDFMEAGSFSRGREEIVAEALRELRRQNLTDLLDTRFSLGSHLNVRDAKAVRKTVAGLVKLLHPDRHV